MQQMDCSHSDAEKQDRLPQLEQSDQQQPTGGPPPYEPPTAASPAAPPPLASYVPPPIAPPAAPGAQPAVAWAPPPAAAAAQGKRTTLAAIAGAVSLIGGILWALLGLLVAVVGGTFFASLGNFAEIPELEGADAGAVLGGVAVFFGVLIIVVGLIYVVAGIGILRSSTWARVLGIIVAIIGGLFWLASLSGAGAAAEAGAGDSTIFTLVHLIANAYIVVALLLFWKSKPATA